MYYALDKISIQGRIFRSLTHIDLGVGALKRLKKSYERFLYMAAKYPLNDENGFIQPTHAVNIFVSDK